VASAQLPFGPGLNIVVGASDSGKTYVCTLIDYLLGAGTPPEDIPESQPYDTAYLGLDFVGDRSVTVIRSFKDEKVRLQEADWKKADPRAPHAELSAVHRTGNKSCLSFYLLSRLGLADLRIRSSKEDLSALTFRHVAHLTIKDEERIITKRSPALTGQYTSSTLDRSAFYFFLTGKDDSESVIAQAEKKDPTTLQAELAIVRGFAEARQHRLLDLIGEQVDVDAQLERLDRSIREATSFASATNEEIGLLENNRADKWAQLNKHNSRRLFLREQTKRLELLRDFYVSDRARLAAILEAGASFRSIKDGTCTVCGSTPDPKHSNIAAVQEGCRTEIAKIDVLHRELEIALREMGADLQLTEDAMVELEAGIKLLDADLHKRLRTQTDKAQVQLTDLVSARQRFESAKETEQQLKELLTRKEQIERDLQGSLKKPKAVSRRKDRTAEEEFCAEVQATLARWQFPRVASVVLDSEKCDLVLNDQARGSFGKGYRAFTHAAFTIGLMRHCFKRGIPHPGFVILDSPLNPLRDPDEVDHNKLPDSMKRAFFEDLASDSTGAQFIIFENTEPPAHLVSQTNYVHFSGNPTVGRAGYFPQR
jgi:hypothetical protein